MRFMINLKNNGYIELGKQSVKYWSGEGIPTFEGDLDGLDQTHPEIIQELIEMKVISRD